MLAGDFNFARPVSFAIEKPGKDTRFVTSFQNLEDKVILRQVAMYLRARFDGLISTNCFSFREDAKIDHTKAVKSLRDYRLKHAGETLWVAECDIRKFFDVIDHGVAMKAFERLAKKVYVDPLARKALEGYLAAYTSTETLLEGAKDTSREKCAWYLAKIKDALSEVPVPIDGRRVGVPQGGAISMLIANWVLDYADWRVERKGDPDLFYARFCDDIVIVHPDKAKCRAARERYLRALRRLLLPYHEVKNRIPYGRGFFETKSKGPYCWRALRKKTERGVSPWVSFLGNQVDVDGAVRVRQDSIKRHVKALKAEQRKMLWLLHATERDGCKVALRGGAAKSDAKRKDAARAMMKSLVAKGVGYLRAGPFAAGDMCWMSAFSDVKGKDAELQLRQLDAVRARLLYPLFKMSGSKRFMGRPASYHGFLEKVERPAPGKERRVFRIGYSEL